MKIKQAKGKKFIKVEVKEPKVSALKCGGGSKCNESN